MGDRRGFAQPITAAVLEQFVLGKPYFDRHGLIVAEEEGSVVGFVHAGFGPDETGAELDFELGATLMLVVRGGEYGGPVAEGLLRQSEAYLQGKGARVLYGGGIHPLSTFYIGLYGGGEAPGVLDSDSDWQQLYERNGYQAVDRTQVFRRQLRDFRPIFDRKTLTLRRTVGLTGEVDPPIESRIEAFSTCGLERMVFQASRRSDARAVASAAFRDLGPYAAHWGTHGVALTHLETAESERRKGWATYLLGETLTRLAEHSFSVVEATTMERNEAACKLYAKLGFELIDAGRVYRKTSDALQNPPTGEF